MEYALPISISSSFYFGKLVTSFARYPGGGGGGGACGVDWPPLEQPTRKNMIRGKTKGNMWVPKTL